jgi:hypothetical protein
MVCGHRCNRCLADFRGAPCALNPARRLPGAVERGISGRILLSAREP